MSPVGSRGICTSLTTARLTESPICVFVIAVKGHRGSNPVADANKTKDLTEVPCCGRRSIRQSEANRGDPIRTREDGP